MKLAIGNQVSNANAFCSDAIAQSTLLLTEHWQQCEQHQLVVNSFKPLLVKQSV
jgi:hypothetical protein